MAKVSFIFFLAVFWVAFSFPGQAVSYAKPADPFVKASAPHAQKTREIIYTIKESESLWQIAKYFGIDPAVLAEFNSLKNPDLIYPGSKLNIQVQDDFSLRVTETNQTGLPDNSGDKQIIILVTNPSQNDIFAPENPLVEVKEIISGPRRASHGGSMVFRTFFEFVEWLVGNDGNFKTTKAASPSNFDPGSSGPYTIASAFLNPPALAVGKIAAASDGNYQSRIPNVSSPPPKSL